MIRLLSLVILSLSSVSTVAGTFGSPSLPFRLPRGGSDSGDADETVGTQLGEIPTSGIAGVPTIVSTSSYASQLEVVKASVLEEAAESIEELRQQIVNEAAIVSDFGSKAEMICNHAMEEFAKNSPESSGALSEASAYDRTLESLEAALDAPLQVLYLRQLSILRDQALQRYRAAAKTSGASEYEAMLQADGKFVRDAEAATREGSDWDYTAERSYLQSVMNSISESSKKATDIQLKSAQQQQTAMQFLQQQQHMIQQLQVQLYGQNSPWNIGFAYRIPDTNFNLQGTYQQGRANIQLSCVPDEYAPFLGPHGFTNGVGPGNLGLSLNLSL